MYISEVEVDGFRNLSSGSVHLSPGRNLLIGPNGAGKTNLLEAVYYLCTSKSFRGVTDEALMQNGKEYMRLCGSGNVDGRETTVEAGYRPGEKKRIRINDAVAGGVASLFEYFRAVSFGPGDTELVLGSPAIRRRFLDISLAQVNRSYIQLLWSYKRVLAQRNALLREMADTYDPAGTRSDEPVIAAWDQKLAELGVELHGLRSNFIARVSAYAESYHQKLAGSTNRLRVDYVASPALDVFDVVRLVAKFESRRSRELAMGQSMYGPHRDDLSLKLNGQECKGYASQGQVKTAVLALKLGICEYIKERTGEYPILLLDEIFSDLDREHLDCLISELPSFSQAIVTTSKIEEINDLSIFEKTLRVENGTIRVN
jgi:DNA replication and repair protein RecF